MNKNPAAVALGKLGKDKPKTLTNVERKRRAERLKLARASRWPQAGSNGN